MPTTCSRKREHGTRHCLSPARLWAEIPLLPHAFAEVAAFGGRRTNDPLRFPTGVLALRHRRLRSLCGAVDSGQPIIASIVTSEKNTRPKKEPKIMPIPRANSITFRSPCVQPSKVKAIPNR